MLDRLRISLLAFLTVVLLGIAGYMVLEDLTFVEAVYLTVATVATVGYGDLVPVTTAGRMFSCALIIVGVGLTYYTFTLVISMSIEGSIKDMLGRRGMDRQIAAMENHIIVCGAGKVGSNVVARLRDEKANFLVIEKEQERYHVLCEQKILAIHGDATLDDVLLKAGVKKAQGIITALSHDADNVYVTLTGKSLNPAITIVARADRPEAEEKLRRAGANTVIFPSVMGGRQMVAALTKPVILDFVENLFFNQDIHVDIAEVKIGETSGLVGQDFIESNIKNRFDSIVVAIKRGDQLINNPKAQEILLAGDIMITVGERAALNALTSYAAGSKGGR